MLPITYKDFAQLTSRRAPFDHPDWIYELKYDGYRVLASKDGTRTSLVFSPRQ
jgi:ATP-dependent DNA ligase